LTQKYARWAAETHYNDLAWGLPGNDDGGTMSAWYLFTAAGIYPIPGTTRYILGTPFFPRMEIKVAQGTLVIIANGVSEKNIYVNAVRWNDESLDKPEIAHDEIVHGGTLVFEMSSKPGTFGVTSP
jgi:putative alpha-1,2-mannosidase